MDYKSVLPYDWFSGPLIGLKDGRLKFAFRVKRGFSNEQLDQFQLHSRAMQVSGLLNESLPANEPLQVVSLVVNDVDELLGRHLNLISTERTELREIIKERARTFRELAAQGKCVQLQVYIVCGYDPHSRQQIFTGQEQPDLGYLLRLRPLKPPSEDPQEPTNLLNSALERLAQVKSSLESYGLELDVNNEADNRRMLQSAQFAGYTTRATEYSLDPSEISVGNYRIHNDYLVQYIRYTDPEGNKRTHHTYHSCLVLKQAPRTTEPGQLVRLLSRAEFTRVAVAAVRPPEDSATIFLNTKKNLNELAVAFADLVGRGQNAQISVQTQELNAVERKRFQDKQQFMYVGVIVVVSAPTLRELQLRIKSTIDLAGKNKLNLTAAECCQEDLWLASLPASPSPLPTACFFRCFPINAAHFLLPIIPWQGSSRPYFLFMNRWRQLVPFDPFGLESSNQFFSGKTRTGKSVQAGMEAIYAAAIGWRVAIIDKLASYHFSMEHVIGGVARSMQPGTFTLNPLAFRVAPGTDLRFASVPVQRVAVVKAFFATILCKKGDKLDPAVDSVLTVALDHTYRRVLRTEGRFPILTDLHDTLRLMTQGECIDETEVELRGDQCQSAIETLSIILLKFRSHTSEEAQIFNGQNSEDFFNADYLYFDVAPLDANEAVQALVSQLLAAALDEWVKACPGRYTFLIMDEIWKYLTRNREMANFMVDSARTYQRFGCALIVVTQSFADALRDDEYAHSLFGQTVIRFALRQDKFDDVLPSFDLESPAVVKHMVSNLKKRKGYLSEMVLMYDRETTTLVNYSSPLFYWATTSDQNLDVPMRHLFIDKFGYTPCEAWVKLATVFPRGVPDELTLARAKNGHFDAA